MTEVLKSLVAKLSSYQFFNFIFPGSLFLGILLYVGINIKLIDNIWWFLLASYSIGICVSRVGSLIIEEALKHYNYIEEYDIKVYATKLKEDCFTGVLLEIANMYRTLSALGLILIVVSLFFVCQKECITFWILFFVGLCLTILFTKSFIKQYNYLIDKLK